MPNLFQINSEILHLFDELCNPETGEIREDVEAKITGLELAKQQKLVSIRNYYQQLAGQIDTAETEINRIQSHVKHLQTVQEAIKRILVANVPEGEKVLDDAKRVVIGWRKCPASIEITDEAKVMEYCQEHLKEAVKTPEPYLLKTPIAKAIEASGVQIDGVKVITGKQNIQVK